MTTLIPVDSTWILFAILVVIAAVAIWLEQKYKWASTMTACVLCLIMAMVLANLRIIPTDAPAYDFVWGYVVPLAVPFLLFKANVKKIWKESGRMLGIFLLSSIGSVVGGIIAFKLLGGVLGNAAAKSAMSMFVGTYVGGSVNLVAMSEATGATGDLVSAAIVADNLLMVLYFFLLVAMPGMKFIYDHFKHPLIDEQKKVTEEVENQASDYWKAKPVSLLDLAKGFAAAFAIVAVSKLLAGIFGDIIPTSNFVLNLLNGLLGNQSLLITTITTVLATVFPGFFGNIAGAQEIGTFLIHIFFAVIGAPASVELIIREAPILLVFAAIVVGMNMIFSLGLGKLFKYSIEEITVASNANIGGPTTSAAFAIAKGWESLIVPTLLVGTLGYVIGNYYGVFLFTLF